MSLNKLSSSNPNLYLNPNVNTLTANSITAASQTISGALSCNSLAVTTAITAASETLTGALGCNSLAVTNAITAASETLTGAMGCNSLNVTTSANIGTSCTVASAGQANLTLKGTSDPNGYSFLTNGAGSGVALFDIANNANLAFFNPAGGAILNALAIHDPVADADLTLKGQATASGFSINATADTNIRVRANLAAKDVIIASGAGGAALLGSSDNSSAAAGFVGEFISSAVAVLPVVVSGAYSNITSIALTAGDWDVSLITQTDMLAALGLTIIEIGVSTDPVAATFVDKVTGSNALTYDTAGNTVIKIPIVLSQVRILAAAPTNIYFKYKPTFVAPTVGVDVSAILRARRVR